MVFGKTRLNREQRRRLQKSVLRDVEVEMVSLLFDGVRPANRKGYVQKCASKKFKSEERGDQGYLYVTVMEPDVKDTQGDVASAAEIQKACEYFSRNGMLKKNDVNHNGKPVKEFFIAENYILKTEDKEHFPDTKVGSWCQVIKCDDLEHELWQKVKLGKFNGVSLAGEGVSDEDDSDVIKSLAKSLEQLSKLKKEATDNGNEDLAKTVEDVIKRVKALETKVNGGGDEIQDKELEKSITELNKSIAGLNKAISPSIKEEGKDMKKLEKSIAGTRVKYDPAKKELYKGFAELDSGKAMGMFNDNLGKQFIDVTLLDAEDDTLSDITVAPVGASGKIDKGLIEEIILYNTDDERIAQDHSHTDLAMDLQELDADISLKESTAEEYRDSYGVDEFGAYMEAKVGGGVKESVKKLIFKGDRTGAASIKAINGLVKKATTAGDITEVDGNGILAKIDNAMLTFSGDILNYQDKFVIYLNAADRLALSQQRNLDQTDKGRLVKEGKELFLDGIPVKARFISSGYMIIGLPKFIVLGYINDAKMKVEHSGSDHKYHWYPRITVDVNYVPGGFVKVFKHTTNQAPYADNVEITEDGLNTGDELAGTYTYHDTYGDAEGTSTFRWLSAATADGSYSAISGATGETLEITAGMATKYIKFEVTPVDVNSVAGSAVLSAAVGPCTNT